MKEHLVRVARHASLQRKLYENRAGWFDEITRVVRERMALPPPPIPVKPPTRALPPPIPVRPKPPVVTLPSVQPAKPIPVRPKPPVVTLPSVQPAKPDYPRCWELPVIPRPPAWNADAFTRMLISELRQRGLVQPVLWCDFEHLSQRAEYGAESLLLPAPGCSDSLPELQAAPWLIE